MKPILECSEAELRALGREVFNRLSGSDLVRWATRVLYMVSGASTPIPEVDALLRLAKKRDSWADAKVSFDALREVTLAEEREARSDPIRLGILSTAENVAKTIYNASGAGIPFDEDSVEWVSVCAGYVLSRVPDERKRAITAAVWSFREPPS